LGISPFQTIKSLCLLYFYKYSTSKEVWAFTHFKLSNLFVYYISTNIPPLRGFGHFSISNYLISLSTIFLQIYHLYEVSNNRPLILSPLTTPWLVYPATGIFSINIPPLTRFWAFTHFKLSNLFVYYISTNIPPLRGFFQEYQ